MLEMGLAMLFFYTILRVAMARAKTDREREGIEKLFRTERWRHVLISWTFDSKDYYRVLGEKNFYIHKER